MIYAKFFNVISFGPISDFFQGWRPDLHLEKEEESLWKKLVNTTLGGGFKYFLFSPYLGKIPILTI